MHDEQNLELFKLRKSGETAVYLNKKDIKQQTKARELIINDIPEHLGSHTAELDNERLVIEQV